jgi:hypothetical protein
MNRGTLGLLPHLPITSPRRRFVGMALAGVVAGTLLTGCSTPRFADMSTRLNKPAATVPKTQPVAAVASAVKPQPRGDLAAGAVTRRLDAGSYKLAVNYWTSQDPSTWTAQKAAVVHLSAHLENDHDKNAVKVSRFLATLDDGTSTATLFDDHGEFAIQPPFSYGGALTVHPVSAKATAATITVEWDLLIETAPKSGQFFRQTVLDTLHLNFVSEGL